MLTGVGLVPAAPLLVDGISPTWPDGVGEVAAAADRVLAEAGEADVTLLLAGAEAPGVARSACADLAGLGRPDLRRASPVPEGLSAVVAEASGLPIVDGPLPLDLAVLSLRLPAGVPVLPVAVPSRAEAGALCRLGAALGAALAADGFRAVVAAASDGAAGLSARAPLHLVDGAGAWQDAYVAGVRVGDLDALGRLGPGEATRVGSRGWAPAVVAAAAAAAAGLRLDVVWHGAPRGVGYLVARTAGVAVVDA